MLDSYFIYHPHEISEECKTVKYHIVNDSNLELKTLCGIDTIDKLVGYGCSSDAITLEWFKQNIDTDEDGIICKKCANKLRKIFKKIEHEKVQ